MKEFFCLVLAIVAIMAALGACAPDTNISNTKCFYFVPDPIAAKEGEFQWLQLSSDEVRYRSGTVIYKINDVIYHTTNYIFIEPK